MTLTRVQCLTRYLTTRYFESGAVPDSPRDMIRCCGEAKQVGFESAPAEHQAA